MLKHIAYSLYVAAAVSIMTKKLEAGVIAGALSILGILATLLLDREKESNAPMLMVFTTPLALMLITYIAGAEINNYFPYKESIATALYSNWSALFGHMESTAQYGLSMKIKLQLNAVTMGVIVIAPLTFCIKVQTNKLTEASSQILGGMIVMSMALIYFIFMMEVYRPNCTTRCINFNGGGLTFFVFYSLGWSMLIVFIRNISALIKAEWSKRT